MTNITRMTLPNYIGLGGQRENNIMQVDFLSSFLVIKIIFLIYINKGKKKRNQSKSQERDIESWKQSSGQTLTCSLKMAWNLPLSILEFVVFSQHFFPINNLLKQQLYRECYKQCYFMTTQLFYLPRIGCGEKKSIKKKKHMIKVLLKKLPFTTHCVVRETYCVYCETFQYDTITVTLLCFERHFGALVPSETASFIL